MTNIINGKRIAKKILKRIAKQVKKLNKQGISVRLAVVLVGRDKASLSFIRQKEKYCRKVGIEFELFKFPRNISEKTLCQKIKKIQKTRSLSGLIVQLPLPRHLHAQKILDQIKPAIDVDCLTSSNLGKLTANIADFLPPTPSACLHLLKASQVSLKGKHVVVVGRGDLVGKPLGIMLTQKQNTITICNKFTKNLAKFTKQADILISAVGKVNLITKEMVKKGVVVLDAGFVFKNKKILGDVDFERISKKAAKITPVPGGVGPVTVAKLLENVIKCANLAKIKQ